MKRKYNTLNEEINRMKSMFGESRLYGNLVGKQSDNIITEQRKFFSNLVDAFRVSLKSFDDFAIFDSFINREIRNIDDIITHVDDFDRMWKIVIPNINTAALKKNLNVLKQVDDAGNLNKIPEDVMLNKVLPGFPEKGGMRDMVYDMWLEANGMSRNLPQKVETRLVKSDPTTGEIIIGTKGESGVVTYKNKDGEVVLVEKPKVDEPDYKPDIEDIDFEEIPAGTKLDDLDGKTVAGTKGNVEGVADSFGDAIDQASKEGNRVVFTVEGVGDEGIKAAQEIMDDITSGKGGTRTKDEMIDEMVEQDITDGKITEADRDKTKKWYKNIFKNLAWNTRYWWNPPTIGEKALASKWGKNITWKKDANRWVSTRFAKIVFRTLVLWPLTLETIDIIRKDDKSFVSSWEDNFPVHFVDDITSIINSIRKSIGSGPVKMTEKIAEDSIINLSDKQINPTTIKTKVINKAMDEILYIDTTNTNDDGTRKSILSCEELLNMKNDAEVIEVIFKNHIDTSIAEQLNVMSADEGISTDTYKEIQDLLTKYFGFVLDNRKKDSKFISLIQTARKNCQEKAKEIEENENMIKDDYEVTVEGGFI